MEQNLVKPGPKALHSANWKPGQSGNENGRPVGVRNAFSTAFLTDLRDVWDEHGRATMVHCAKVSPEVFFATCARLCPANVQLSIEQQFLRTAVPATPFVLAPPAAIIWRPPRALIEHPYHVSFRYQRASPTKTVWAPGDGGSSSSSVQGRDDQSASREVVVLR